VPGFRRDVTQEDDLVEEVARVWGYERIPATLNPGHRQSVVRRPPALRLARAVNRALVAAGLSEVTTYAFVDPGRLKEIGWTDETALVRLQNPLSRERSVMRPVLAVGLLEAVATNVSRQAPSVRIFEIGRVFGPHRPEDGDHPAHEELWLGIALTGTRGPRAWHTAPAAADVHDVKGAATLALLAAGVTGTEVGALSGAPLYLDPDRSATLLVDGGGVGRFGEVTAEAAQAFGLAHPVFLAEVSLSALASRPVATPVFQGLPRFPAVQRDLAVIVDAGITAAAIEAAIRGLSVPYLARLTLFDVYQGKQVAAGRRSLAWSLVFQAPDQTLTDEEVNGWHGDIVREIIRRFGAEIRGT